MSARRDNDTFADILDRARNGDRSALDQLLSRLEERFKLDAEQRVGEALRGRTRVSDILQDAYLEVVRRFDGFAGTVEAEFYSWVSAIIENSARQQHRFLTAQKRKPPSRSTELNALAAAYFRSTTSPASALQQAENLALVHQAVESLRDDYRVVIEQVVFQERAVIDVANDLERSESATRMLLSRARAALTIKLDELKRASSRTKPEA